MKDLYIVSGEERNKFCTCRTRCVVRYKTLPRPSGCAMCATPTPMSALLGVKHGAQRTTTTVPLKRYVNILVPSAHIPSGIAATSKTNRVIIPNDGTGRVQSLTM